MKGKISIIVPIYNVEKYLHRCIDSILNQTFVDFELILINDGSTDKSPVICDDYSKKDNRIKVIHKPNGGVSSARNLGIDIAQGKYIGFVDPDDYIDKNMYKILYENIEKSKSEIAISSFSFIREGIFEPQDTSNIIKKFSKEEAINKFFDMEYPFNYSFLWNKLFKTCLFKEKKIRLNQHISIQEDTEIMIKLYNESSSIIYVGFPLYFYEIRFTGASLGHFPQKNILTEKAFWEIYKYTNRSIPEYKSKALFKYISCFLNTIVEIIRNYNSHEDDYYKLIARLRKMPFQIMITKGIPMKYKMHSIGIIISPKIYKKYIESRL